MINTADGFDSWLNAIVECIKEGEIPPASFYTSFLQDTTSVNRLIDQLNALDDAALDNDEPLYGACIFGMDVLVSQLQMGIESHDRKAQNVLQELMRYLAQVMHTSQHTVPFWMPVLNIFYETHVELTEDLKEVYLQLAEEEAVEPEQGASSTSIIRQMVEELAHLSVFDIAEHLFSQSHAMPADFFEEIAVDLFRFEQGYDVGILLLMHPNQDVREVVVMAINEIIDSVTLTPQSLSRLKAIQSYFPDAYHHYFSRWIKVQRKQGVVFAVAEPVEIVRLVASEVDGGGAQGLFVCVKDKQSQYRVASLLCKQGVGIKDAWVTPNLNKTLVNEYFEEAFDDVLTLRKVDVGYLSLIINHFLVQMLSAHRMPGLHLLEIQEMLGLAFHPQAIEVSALIQELAVQIAPFTAEVVATSLKRSQRWTKTKRFTESWYLENANVDRVVNQFSNLVEGIKVCNFDKAMAALLTEEFESHRDWWCFHFLWVALWAKVHHKKNEKLWIDAFTVAYLIDTGTLLVDIPIMRDITKQTLLNSMETMQARRTHLS